MDRSRLLRASVRVVRGLAGAAELAVFEPTGFE
ncbi:hypothetical protein ENSA7_37730 [Enhygromyxa salina]|uniref:Uncharacterized protein n=1 Tax=Enhygromyxa salina TaxID=215803 RepID=A0A2S9YMZ8_9BACT|nr:hypothetical protein ENSA7_37730 [Enhygromyxa salina]